MSSRQSPETRPSRTPGTGATIFSDKRVEEALAAVHRSLATSQFYPPNHPLLLDALKDGFQAWTAVEEDHRLRETGLRLRNGSLWLDEGIIGENNPAVLGLARSFAAHGLVGVVQRGGLSLEGFSQFVTLLASTPDALLTQGGLTGAWKSTPFADTLELQQLAVAAGARSEQKKNQPGRGGDEWGRGLPSGAEIPAMADPFVLSRLKAFQHRGPRERRLLDLLLRLGRTEHISAFLELLKEIARLTQEYVGAERFREAFHVILFLYREAQNMDALAKEGKRDYLIDTLHLLLRGPFLQWVISFVLTERGHEEAEVGEYVLRALGKSVVVPLINTLVLEKDRIGRRRIIDVLVSIGAPVVPLVVRMLDDQRWYVVRNMVTILGGVSTPEALKALSRLSGDPDSRIRREVVRAVARSSGPLAEETLLRLLGDPDPAVRMMAISAATCQRSPQVLEALWAMYRRISIRVPEWNLKAQILLTLGRMGLAEAADRLETAVLRKPFFWRKRWETVRVAGIQALGELGGQKARRLLEGLLDDRSPEVRRATVRALAACGDGRTEEDSCPAD